MLSARRRLAYRHAYQRRSFGLVESALVAVHTATGLPWFATFALSTVAVRMSLLPLVRQQIIESRKLSEAMPKIDTLLKLYAQKTKGRSFAETGKEMGLLLDGTRAVFHIHEFSPLRMLAFPVVNIGLFATFVLSLRGMIAGDSRLELTTGGILWFTDLIAKDLTCILPLTAVGVSYLALHIAFIRNSAGVALTLRDTFQSLLILALPLVIQMPSGLFFYWIPSSLCGIAQHILLRNPAVLTYIGIPTSSKSNKPPGQQ